MADTQEERQKRDEQIRETIMAKLIETGNMLRSIYIHVEAMESLSSWSSSLMTNIHSTGEKDKLKEMLRERLVQCGWRDELKEYCKEVIRKKGLEKVTVEELVADITPQGRGRYQWILYICMITIPIVNSFL